MVKNSIIVPSTGLFGQHLISTGPKNSVIVLDLQPEYLTQKIQNLLEMPK